MNAKIGRRRSAREMSSAFFRFLYRRELEECEMYSETKCECTPGAEAK